LLLRLPARLIPPPNLAQRIEQADSIVVATLISGTTFALGSRVSSDIVLHVNRVLKGELIPGSDIAAHIEGDGYFVAPGATQSAIREQLYGIWFLTSASHVYSLVSRVGNSGELDLARSLLPEGAPAGKAGETPAASVAN